MQAGVPHTEAASFRSILSLARGPLRVAVVDEELPYPPTSGKRIRTLNLLLRLARRHCLTLICHRNADPEEARHAAEYLQASGIETIALPRTVPRKTGAGFYLRLAANLLAPLPYSVATHDSAALRRALCTYAATHPVDLWQCEWTPYAQAMRVLGDVPMLVMAHNVESVIWRRYQETTTGRLRRWYIGRQRAKFERFERRTFETTRTIAVSDADAALIAAEYGGKQVDVVDNGVDTTYFRPVHAPRDFKQILYLGSLDWRPNLDAVKLLLDRIFPAVRAAEPDAHLCLVGRNPPAWLAQRVAHLRGVVLHASVPDVRPHLHRSGVMAVPLRIGGGSRLKILEALACGLPVISTAVGAEGLCLEAGRDLTVVKAPEQMADALVQAIRNPAAALAQAERGRQVVFERYDWDALADRLETIWRQCVLQNNVGRLAA